MTISEFMLLEAEDIKGILLKCPNCPVEMRILPESPSPTSCASCNKPFEDGFKRTVRDLQQFVMGAKHANIKDKVRLWIDSKK